jgi:hypothetical protein
VNVPGVGDSMASRFSTIGLPVASAEDIECAGESRRPRRGTVGRSEWRVFSLVGPGPIVGRRYSTARAKRSPMLSCLWNSI